MRKFKVTGHFQRFFTVIVDGITKLESLVFNTNDHLRIITDVIQKLMKSNTTIHIQTAITSEAALHKKGGNILFKGLLRIINKLKQESKITANFACNFIIKMISKLHKKISFATSEHLIIYAEAETAIYRPFGGLPDNPDYNPDGVDNLAFGDMDDWDFWTCDRIVR